ncbi:vWA domain-containing protein [Methanocella conradii]|uniref:vWA domain-containing protein n=1 Tax=Methanocella conradii TaxID=1175444 RepID=UPI00157CD8CF|nr:VWA domain-containing protein [Methanocella conradii]
MTALDGILKEPLDSEEIMETIILPRNIPRGAREEIASILYREIVLGEDYEIRDARRFIERLGVFYLLFISLKASGEWAKLKSLAGGSHVSRIILLKIILNRVLDLLDSPGLIDHIWKGGLSESMLPYFEQFKAMLEKTMELWHRRVKSERPISLEASSSVGLNDVGLVEQVERYQEDDGSRQFLGLLAGDTLLAISESVNEVEGHLASLETLSLLFPGRGWDHAMLELHKSCYASLDKYSKLVELNEDLRKMLDGIGRSEAEPGVRRASSAGHGRSELYSITTSNDLQHMLPVESVKLQDETLKALFFARWIEGKLLTYQLIGKGLADGPRKKRGPMVALVDTSGSMHGAPEVIAKSVVLALVRRMLKENRDVKVFLFSSVEQSACIELTGSRRMASEILDFLNYTFEGGTDFNTALKEGLDALKEREYENADLLFITDGLSAVSDERLLARLEDVKRRNGTRLYTIIVGNDDAGGLSDFSDHVFILARAGAGGFNGPEIAIKLISAKHK